MFEPKKLYTVKRYFCYIFPTKEQACHWSLFEDGKTSLTQNPLGANYWSKELGCLVTFIEPNSNFLVLEVDGKFVKIVGDRVGWIVVDTSIRLIRECFREITHV